MQTYSQYKPTRYDLAGLCGEVVGADRLVVPCGRNRDSDCLEESNFAAALKMLGGESGTVAVHRFGHWACGWFEIIAVKPDTPAALVAADIESRLESYPVLDESDFSEREAKAADDVWRDCYQAKERAAYIREHSSQFEFRNWRDMRACVRGEYFAGYACEILS